MYGEHAETIACSRKGAEWYTSVGGAMLCVLSGLVVCAVVMCGCVLVWCVRVCVEDVRCCACLLGQSVTIIHPSAAARGWCSFVNPV